MKKGSFSILIALLFVSSCTFIPQQDSPDSTEIEYGFIAGANQSNQTNHYPDGFLIEFEEPPMIIKKLTLEEEFTPPDQISPILDSHLQSLKSNHIQFKRYVEEQLKKEFPRIKSFDYYNSFNGMYLKIDSYELEKIKKHPRIKSISRNFPVQANLMDALPLFNISNIWGSGHTGSGMEIAIIDTGIDYTHPDLGGCFGTNCKVKGGYDFVNDDSDPIDDHAHGTHCAGIAAGNGVLKGVAPDAKLYAYKVLSASAGGSSSQVLAGMDAAIDPNGDGDFSDSVDVISMSLGARCSAYGYPEDCGPNDPLSRSADNIAELGITIVVSAGNDGPGYSTVGSPGTSRKVITIGASENNVWRTSELSIGGNPLDSNGLLRSSLTTNMVAELKDVGGLGYPSDFQGDNYNGKIVLIERGELSFKEKAENAHDAGAIAAIIYNNGAGEFIGFSPDLTPIPVLTISQNTGQDLVEMINQGAVQAQLSVEEDLSGAEEIAQFSSRGPIVTNYVGITKPEVVAPGTILCSARYSDTDSSKDAYKCIDDGHLAMSGTSMSTPYVAGLVSLLKQKNPEWTHEEIKMALRNSATDHGHDINTQGYGRINPLNLMSIQKQPIAYIETSGKVTGNQIQIMGKATGENFEGYTLYYAPGLYYDMGGISWIEICSSTEEAINSSLCELDILSLQDGVYTLKLEVNSDGYQSRDHTYIEKKNVEITSPPNRLDLSLYDTLVPLPTWAEELEILGSVNMPGLDYYTLEWKKGQVTTSGDWSNSGITLANNGEEIVVDDLIAKLDLSLIDEISFYSFKLIASSPTIEETYYAEVFFDPTIHEGWPKEFGIHFSGPLLATIHDQPIFSDVNKDGTYEVITSYNQYVEVFDHKGDYLPGWPVQIETDPDCYYSELYPLVYGPAAADIDGDGYDEIVVGDQCGYIHMLNHDGTYSHPPKYLDTQFLKTPKVGDIDCDNKLEIFIQGYPEVFLLNENLELESGWPISGGISENPIVLADLNQDGCDDVISIYSSYLKAYDYTGQSLLGWEQIETEIDPQGGISGNGLVAADLNQDGEVEIIMGYKKIGEQTSMLYVFNSNGTLFEDWPIETDTNRVFSLSVGDINLDGELEIITSGYWDFCLSIFDIYGQEWPGYPRCEVDNPNYPKSGQPAMSQPMVASVDSDNNMEMLMSRGVLHGSNNIAYAYFGYDDDGTHIGGFPKPVETAPYADILIFDIDNDGYNELILPFNLHDRGYIWDTPGNSSFSQWPMTQHDPRQTGNYEFTIGSSGMLCPNGVLDEGEDCEPTLPIGETCETYLGAGWSGDLLCTESCTFDISNCIPPLGEQTMSLSLVPGWNSISIPFQDSLDISLLNSDKIFTYDSETQEWLINYGPYEQIQELNPIKGYLVYSDEYQTLTLSGFDFNLMIEPPTNWRLEGVTLGNNDTPIEEVYGQGYQVYGWTGSEYIELTSSDLHVGEAYWIAPDYILSPPPDF
jgi:subtilisin family serine protease